MAHAVKKIKLFIDAHAFDKEHQGTRSFIKRLYSEFALREPAVELFFGAVNIDTLRDEFSHIPGCNFVKYRSGSSLFRLAIEIPRLLKKHGIHLAHFQYILPFFCSCRTIVTTHDVLFIDYRQHFPWLFRITRTILFRRSIMKADIRTTVSQYSRERIHHHFGIPLHTILITPSGVDREFFLPYDKEQSREFVKRKHGLSRFILYVSRFEPRKNHELLLKIFLHLRLYERGIHLVLLGHYSLPSPGFTALLEQLPEAVRKFILVNQEAGDEDLRHFYRAADAFVYPSLAEGFGLPPVEAAALRVPVLCSNATAMQDYGFFGRFHVDPADFATFSARLDEILRRPPSESELNAIAKEVEGRYTFKAPAEKLAIEINKLFRLPN